LQDTATKHAVIGITRNGAKFYGPLGIRCNAICPEPTTTPMLAESMGEAGKVGTEANEKSDFASALALRRIAMPQEQENVISFLLSVEYSYINGAHIVVDRGWIDIR
jgi:NAD(P)-dependent dehydrogenase (short-subunit alcohol dehydrogenase family)